MLESHTHTHTEPLLIIFVADLAFRRPDFFDSCREICRPIGLSTEAAGDMSAAL